MSRDSSGSPTRSTPPAIPSLLLAGAVTLVCATTATTAMAQATASAWPQFRHDTQHTGVNPSSAAVANGVVFIASNDSAFTAHDAHDGNILWRASISAGNSSPAVANGVVYASGTLGLSALDAETGSLLKNLNFGFAHYSSPAVVNGMVYVGGFDGTLRAFGLPR